MIPVKLFPMLAAAAPAARQALEVVQFWLLPVLVPVCAVVSVIYYVNSRPLRRQEAARFVLDLIESAGEQGQPVEHLIVSLARSRDASPGVRFHLLAAWLEKGCGLIPALERVPELLPPQVLAMLKVGATLGGFSRVLPACRHLLKDGTSQTRALINYQVAFGLILNPLVLMLLPIPFVKIFPVFNDVAASLGLRAPLLYRDLPHLFPILFVLQLIMLLGCFVGAIFVLGGARFFSWLDDGIVPLTLCVDWLLLRVPWRRKRLQRDFAAMLGLLLDAGVPEEQAVTLAGFSTANAVFQRRAERVAERLRRGIKLADAMQAVDETGEFRWRLKNGAHGPGGFFSALEGWNKSLDAQAFRQEQAAAHTISTSLILLNAVTVALVAVGVFQFISQLSSTTFK